MTEVLDPSLQETKKGTLIDGNSLVGAEDCNVIRDLLCNINENEATINLGDDICVIK